MPQKQKQKKASGIAAVARKKKNQARQPKQKQRPKGKSRLPAVLGLVGSAVGNRFFPGIGGAVGGMLGEGAGSLIGKITGHGDYSVKMNSLLTPGHVPEFGDSRIRVRRKEYLGDVVSTTSFVNTMYSVNPGLSTTFPWLSAIASNYQQYIMHGIVFEFVSTSADALNSTNTALGKLIMATNYNVNEAQWSSQEQMLATKFSNLGKPAENLIHAIECDPKQLPAEVLNIRTSGLSSGDTLKLYDLGNFQIATNGMQAAANIGTLWVSYDVTLIKPVLTSLVAESIASSAYRHFYSNSLTSTGEIVLAGSDGPVIATLVPESGTGHTRLEFAPDAPTGSYLFALTMYRQSGGTPVPVPTLTLNDLTPIGSFYNSSGVPNGNPNAINGASGSTFSYLYQVGISGLDPYIDIQWAGVGSSVPLIDIYLVHVAGATLDAKKRLEVKRREASVMAVPYTLLRRIQRLEKFSDSKSDFKREERSPSPPRLRVAQHRSRSGVAPDHLTIAAVSAGYAGQPMEGV